MKKILFTLIISLFYFSSKAQTFGVSPKYSFNIQKLVVPPILEFTEALHFVDEDGNNAINANEKCGISFKLRNSGKGDALNLRSRLTVSGNNYGLIFNNSESLLKVDKNGGVQSYFLPINSDFKTIDGVVEFTLEIIEPYGFNSDKLSIQVNTRKFLPSQVKVVDYVIYSGIENTKLEKKRPFTLQLLVQNIGQGIAKDVKLNFIVPENVFLTSGESIIHLNNLAPNEKRSIEYEVIINAKYSSETLPFVAKVTESSNNFGYEWSKKFILNQSLARQKIIIQPEPEATIKIDTASLKSDVDKDIPIGLPINTKKYALIIGCENYAKFQTGLTEEVNAEFAANDAIVFAEYANLTLGFPKDQIYILIDPTTSQIKQYLERIVKAMEIEKGKAEIIFYYSGHGLLDEETKTPYLIPVDVNGSNPKEGIALTTIYKKLVQFPSIKTTIILDACFSGGARNKQLIALKGVRIKPKYDDISGNLIVMASSSGSESSAVFKEKQHGYFTYFLLKNIKESKGKNNFSILFEDVRYKVSKEVLKIGKSQNPELIPGNQIGETWKLLKW
jgi:hypothetical protein